MDGMGDVVVVLFTAFGERCLFVISGSYSDSDSDHMLQSQLGQRIYAICDMKHGMRALLQGGALASCDVMPSSFYSTVPPLENHQL